MPENDTISPAKWTVMIYMAANDKVSNKASEIFFRDLNEIGRKLDSLGKPCEVNILLQVYLKWNSEEEKNQYRAKRFKIHFDFEKSDPIDTLGPNVKMGDTEALTGFITWCKTNYPAKKYLLLLWGHGTGSGLFQAEIEEVNDQLKEIAGFELKDIQTKENLNLKELISGQQLIFAPGTNEAKFNIYYKTDKEEVTDTITVTKQLIRQFKNNPKYFLRSDNPETLAKLRGYITSEPNLDALTGTEVNRSLKSCFGSEGKIDLLLILGCCMQLVEYGYEIGEHCRYYVASEELIFFEGYNYYDTFSTLIENPSMNEKELGTKLVQDTVRRADYNDEETKYIAISCVDLQKSRKLAEFIDNLAQKFLTAPEELKYQIRHSRGECSHFGERSYSSFIDIVWFLKRICHNISELDNYSELRQEIKDLIRYIEEEYIVEAFIGENKIPKPEQLRSLGGHGVAIYFPETMEDHLEDEERGKYFNRNEKLYTDKFSKFNKWNNMFFEYMKASTT